MQLPTFRKFRLRFSSQASLHFLFKLLIFVLIFANLQVEAKTVIRQKISLHLKNVPFEKVLHKIEVQSGFNVLFDRPLIQDAAPVTLELKDETLEQALKSCFSIQPSLTYAIVGKEIIVKRRLRDEDIGQQAVKIPEFPIRQLRVFVTDSLGTPLVGASVQVEATAIGGRTDAEGNTVLNGVEDLAKIRVSYVGYKSMVIETTNETTLHVTLLLESNALNEIVIVGYGSQKKENLTGAIATVQGKEIGDRPTSSPANLLQGLASGLTVSKGGQGDYPGSTSSIKVRNFATWQGGANQPLYVIDGFIRDKAAFDNVNPNDIASISILKDAASASIYGMEAGNGVILITTKSGSESQTRISYNVNHTYNKPTRLPKLMNAFEDATLQNSMYLAQGLAPDNPNYFSPDELEYFKSHTYNSFTDAWKDPSSTSHNLSVSGGNKKIHYLVSGSYLHQDGGLNQQFDKYTLLAKLDGEIAKGLSFSLNIDGAFTNNKRPNFPYGTDQNMSYFWYYMYYALPWKPTFINGLPVAGGAGDASNGMVFVNEKYMDHNYRIDQNNTLNTIFELKYKIPQIEGLGAKATIGLNKGYNYFKYFNAADKVYFFKVGGDHNHIVTSDLDLTNPGGDYGLNNIVTGAYGAPQYLQTGYSQAYAYQLDLMLTYDRSFGKHNINAFVAFEPAENNGNYLNGYGKNYSNLNYQEISGASTAAEDRTAEGTSNYFGQESYFGRIN